MLGGPAGADWRPRSYGEETAAAIDRAVRHLIDDAFRKAVAILSGNKGLVEEAAQQLLIKETLSETDLAGFARRLRPIVDTPSPSASLAAQS